MIVSPAISQMIRLKTVQESLLTKKVSIWMRLFAQRDIAVLKGIAISDFVKLATKKERKKVTNLHLVHEAAFVSGRSRKQQQRSSRKQQQRVHTRYSLMMRHSLADISSFSSWSRIRITWIQRGVLGAASIFKLQIEIISSCRRADPRGGGRFIVLAFIFCFYM